MITYMIFKIKTFILCYTTAYICCKLVQKEENPKIFTKQFKLTKTQLLKHNFQNFQKLLILTTLMTYDPFSLVIAPPSAGPPMKRIKDLTSF